MDDNMYIFFGAGFISGVVAGIEFPSGEEMGDDVSGVETLFCMEISLFIIRFAVQVYRNK